MRDDPFAQPYPGADPGYVVYVLELEMPAQSARSILTYVLQPRIAGGRRDHRLVDDRRDCVGRVTVHPAAEVLPATLRRKLGVRGRQRAPTRERVTIRLSRTGGASAPGGSSNRCSCRSGPARCETIPAMTCDSPVLAMIQSFPPQWAQQSIWLRRQGAAAPCRFQRLEPPPPARSTAS